ncbi:MAG: hypothetical protein ACOY46_04665 [Bacillota bacterium]
MMNNRSIKVAVKYCGGCNPEIDRENIISRLTAETGLDIYHFNESAERPDILIAVNGCPRGCLMPGPAGFQDGKVIVIAGLSIDCWPVTQEEMTSRLIGRLKAMQKTNS